MALGLAAADGPLPIGDLISLGMTIWMVWDLIEMWDQLWQEADDEVQSDDPERAEEPEALEEEPEVDAMYPGVPVA